MPMYNSSDRRCNPEELDPCLAAEIRIKNDLLAVRQSKCLLCFVLGLLTILLLVAAGVVLFYNDTLTKRFVQHPQQENPPSKMEPPSNIKTRQSPDMIYFDKKFTERKSSKNVHGIRTLSKDEINNNDVVEVVTTRYLYYAPVTTVSPPPSVETVGPTTITTTTTSPTPNTSTGAAQPNGWFVTATALPLSSTTTTTTLQTSTTTTTTTTTIITTTAAPVIPNLVHGDDNSTVNGTSDAASPIEVSNAEPNPIGNLSFQFDYVNTSEKTMEGCQEYRRSGHAKSGVYNISWSGAASFPALCIMDTHYAWTVLHRRSSEKIVFWNATFDEYADGFGDVRGDHWLGLNRLHEFMKHNKKDSVILRIILQGSKCSRRKCAEEVEQWWGDWEFSILSRNDGFKLTHIKFLEGNISNPNNEYFSTLSRNQVFTVISGIDKKGPLKGGWWHGFAKMLSLNGKEPSWYWAGDKGNSYFIRPNVSLIMFR